MMSEKQTPPPLTPARRSSGPPEHPKGVVDEKRLLHDIKRLSANTKGRWVVRGHLSRMKPDNLADHTLHAVEHTFNGLVTREGVRFYWLRNNDFVVSFSITSADSVRAALVKVRFLFAHDPLMDQPAAHGVESDSLATWYRLDNDHGLLLKDIQQLVQSHRAPSMGTPRRHLRQNSDPGSIRRGAPLTAAMLSRVESALMGADLSSHIRRQAVCAMVGRAAPDPVFTEVFVSINDLRETMLPHVDLASNPWLFQHLTQTLDRRVLAMLTRRDDKTLNQGFSINLNVSTILSDDFLRFDDSLSPGSHGTVVLEVRSEDIFADLNAFFFARDFVRQRGYRLCVDGLNWRTLPFVDPTRLGVDLMKLSWSDDLPNVLHSAEGDAASAVLARTGQGKIILARCDDEKAVQFGQGQGIRLFQGRYIDRITKPYLLL